MPQRKAEIVICGAGIMGISAAYFLAVRQGIQDIVLVDERPPLTLTSDKSTEAYRNWWPGPGDAMVSLMNRSIDLMEEMAGQNGNLFRLNRRGYLYVTKEKDQIPKLQASALEAAQLGAGDLRVHENSAPYRPHQAEGFEDELDGADLLLSPELLAEHFPYLATDVAAALHVRRAGWLSAQTYGMWMLEEARAAGVEIYEGRVAAVEKAAGRVAGIHLTDGTRIESPIFINAAGPFLADVAALCGVEVPIFNELHVKASFPDSLGVIDRAAPLIICADEQQLDWTDEERALLAEDEESAWLLDTLPFGAHARPEGEGGADTILVLWDTHNEPVEASLPLEIDPLSAEIAIRGLVGILPGLNPYLEKMPRPFMDGGYYTKTAENRPLAGPMGVEGAYLIGAASGYGIMAAAGLAELLAAHISGDELPDYASALALSRYEDPDYKELLANWGDSWQL